MQYPKDKVIFAQESLAMRFSIFKMDVQSLRVLSPHGKEATIHAVRRRRLHRRGMHYLGSAPCAWRLHQRLHVQRAKN